MNFDLPSSMSYYHPPSGWGAPLPRERDNGHGLADAWANGGDFVQVTDPQGTIVYLQVPSAVDPRLICPAFNTPPSLPSLFDSSWYDSDPESDSSMQSSCGSDSGLSSTYSDDSGSSRATSPSPSTPASSPPPPPTAAPPCPLSPRRNPSRSAKVAPQVNRKTSTKSTRSPKRKLIQPAASHSLPKTTRKVRFRQVKLTGGTGLRQSFYLHDLTRFDESKMPERLDSKGRLLMFTVDRVHGRNMPTGKCGFCDWTCGSASKSSVIHDTGRHSCTHLIPHRCTQTKCKATLTQDDSYKRHFENAHPEAPLSEWIPQHPFKDLRHKFIIVDTMYELTNAL